MNNPQPTFKDLSGIFSTPKPLPAEAPQPLETENITTDENKVLLVALDDTVPNTELIIDESPQILLDDGEEEQGQEEKIVDNSDNEMEEYECEDDMER